jgi:hypothetical protein
MYLLQMDNLCNPGTVVMSKSERWPDGKGDLAWKMNQGEGLLCVVRESEREKWEKKKIIKD